MAAWNSRLCNFTATRARDLQVHGYHGSLYTLLLAQNNSKTCVCMRADLTRQPGDICKFLLGHLRCRPRTLCAAAVILTKSSI